MDPGELNVLFRVWLVSRAAMGLVNSALEPCELDGDDLAVYSMLAAAPGITPSELAEWLAAPASTVSSFVKRLEGREHAERIANAADRRSYGIRLTSKGRRAHREAAAHFEPALDRLVEALGSDHMEVRDRLLQLRHAIDAVSKPPGGEVMREAANGSDGRL